MKIRKILAVSGLAGLAVGLSLAILFGPAGRLDWGRGWLFVGLLFGPSLVLLFALYHRNPELFRRRMSIGHDTRAWDRVLVPLLKFGFTAGILVGAWDAGKPGRATFGPIIWIPAAGVFLVGYALLIYAMLTNTHFESYVRIQHDRTHRVVDTGPYRWVRHPGYTGLALLIAATPFVLGSLWALVPTLITLGILGLRTALEGPPSPARTPGLCRIRDSGTLPATPRRLLAQTAMASRGRGRGRHAYKGLDGDAYLNTVVCGHSEGWTCPHRGPL